MGWLAFISYLAIASFSGYLLLYLLIRPTRAANPLLFLSISCATGLAAHAAACFVFNQWFAIPLTKKTVLLIAIILLLSLALILWLMRRFLTSLEHLAGRFRAARTAVVLFRTRPLEWRFFFWAFWLIVVVYGAIVVLAPTLGRDPFFYHFPFAHTIFSTGFLPKTVSLGGTEFENAYPPVSLIIMATSWLVLGFESQKAAAILSICFGVSCALVAGSLVRLVSGKRAAQWAAAFLFLTIPTVLMQLSIENIDFIAAAFAGCALWYYAAGVERPRLMRPVAVGLFAALAAWGKYHYFILPALFILTAVALALLSPFLGRSSQRRLPSVWSVVLIVAVFCVVIAPFIARNYFFFGNPVYPLFPQLFHGLNADEWWRAHSWGYFQFAGFRMKNLDWGFIVFVLQNLPFILLIPAILRVKACGWRPSSAALAVFAGLFFLTWVRYFNVGGSGDQARFLLLTFIVVSAFSAPVFADILLAPFPNPSEAASSILFASAVLIGWVASYRFFWVPFTSYFFHFADWNPFYTFGVFSRFLFVGVIVPLIAVAFISAAAYEKIKKRDAPAQPKLGFPLAVVRYASSALIVGILVAPIARHASIDVGYIVSHTSAGDVEIGEPLRWMQANVPVDAVIFTGEPMTYLFPHACIPFDCAAARPVWEAAASSWDGALAELKRLGVTHFYTSYRFAAFPTDSKYRFSERVREDTRHFTLVYRGKDSYNEDMLLYRVDYSP